MCVIISVMGRPKGSKNGIRKTIDKTCEICGKSYKIELWQIKKNRFCSRACQHVGHSMELIKTEIKICPECGRDFVATGHLARVRKYCSKECYKIAHGRAISGIKDGTKIDYKFCIQCGKPFVSHAQYGQIFCSKKCANKGLERKVTLICQYCGEEYVSRRKHRGQKFCSDKCRFQASGHFKSSLEEAIEKILKELKLSYIPQVRKWYYTIDFLVDNWLAIECDGEYWHLRPEVIERDKRKDAYLASISITVLRLSGNLITHNITQCRSLILEALSQRNNDLLD
jgi:endogenous inhibitor of DNA gyrase (YacG/DUF329 family)